MGAAERVGDLRIELPAATRLHDYEGGVGAVQAVDDLDRLRRVNYARGREPVLRPVRDRRAQVRVRRAGSE